MCQKTIEQNIVLGEKIDSLSNVVKDMVEDRKRSKDLLFQLSKNQVVIQEQIKNNNKEHSELGDKFEKHFSYIKKSLDPITLDIAKNTSFRLKVLGVLTLCGFLGSGALLAFFRK